MKSSAGMDLIRSVFAAIDRGVYGLIGTLYSYIEKIAEHELLDPGILNNISNKLYSFIAIFMLFKISFSLINYIINPDSIVDKEKGGSKLITNILITFGLIIVAPFGFKLLYEAQTTILNEHLISNILLSDTPTTDKTLYISSYCKDYGYNPVMPSTKFDSTTLNAIYDEGEYISLITLRPFVQVDDNALSDRGEETVKEFLKSGYCDSSNINSLLSQKNVNFDNSDLKKVLYIMDYNILLSTIVGIIVALIFAGFCLDAALRTVKLYFLQVIAPIPIMSYIDPSSSKKGLFSKWLKEVGITWADLFLRLAAVYFAIFIISNIEVNTSDGLIMNVLLILGTLMFAKKLPDILKKMFNIDLKGDFSLNPLKKIKDAADFAKPVTGLAGGTIGAAAGAVNFARGNNWKQKLVNGFSGIHKGWTNGYKNPYSITKGGLSSLSPFADKIKKSWSEQDEARGKLKEFDKFETKGEGLIKEALTKAKNKGSLSEDGTKYNIDEFKVDNFKNQEYVDSFNGVQNAKKELKKAKNQLIKAKSDMEYLNSNPNATQEERNEALKRVQDASNNVDKLTGVLDSKKSRHKIVQQQYKKDAELESAMEEYLNRHPDALNVENSPRSTIGIPSGTVGSGSAIGVNGNGEPVSVRISDDSPLNSNILELAKQINKLSEHISNFEAKRDNIENSYAYSSGEIRRDSDNDSYNKEHKKLEDEIAKLSLEKIEQEKNLSKLIETDPEKAIEQLQQYVDEVLKEQAKQQKEEVKNAREEYEKYSAVTNYDPSDYNNVKRKLERAELALQNTNSEIDKIVDQIDNDLPRLVRKQQEAAQQQRKAMEEVAQKQQEIVDEAEDLFTDNE